MQWLQGPKQNNVRREACRYIRNKNEDYQKVKSDYVGAWTGAIWLGTGGRHPWMQ
jgi:hypothetical protein